MEDQPKKVVKIKVTDKRRGSEAPSGADISRGSEAPSGADDISRGSEAPSGADISRGSEAPSGADDIDLRSDSPRSADASLRNSPVDASAPAVAAQEERDFLDDLRRLQAEFDNYRKRLRREQEETGERATAKVIEELLPVIDNFERAIAHGEGGEGVQLVFKDLSAALERLGLVEIPAEGAAFDPNVHEAMELRETEGLEEPTVIEVYRRGYMLNDRLIRPASVVVGRPSENESE